MTNSQEAVIQNIKKSVNAEEFHNKVEVNDPIVSREEIRTVLDEYVKEQPTISYKFKLHLATTLANVITIVVNRKTKIIGAEKIKKLNQPGIVTSNHFNPLENTAIRKALHKGGYHNMAIVSQATNNRMSGVLGFFMNYANVIPIAAVHEYMGSDFLELVKHQLDEGNPVLIYPEQEMWFNYRKPRPPQRGAYYYAAKFNVPIISCFTEIIDLGIPDSSDGHLNKVCYRVHVLDPIFPDPELNVKENSYAMMQKDYDQKKLAYESAYNKPLSYDFEPDDIAGWHDQS
ncbi:lysophospholipid acyltransferase family protein [Lentilactobacillus sp. SPB1-3]|uniref:Lysophospholipid acyltransferase family protein n=1 Tax=Lentilactobacillus terminaliae TaxID=3003483 RepID=A0ACD5DFB9_9LACO|nr:lysophospholipid acyltransferase family protein [Lentilactobacillus sp. SPB1-3]MCZ0976618.1 lysophospholipid acyltransferase family protein [Lentilactobacillus sp. SPB1-3]